MKQNKIKMAGDARLVDLIEELQKKIALQNSLNTTTVDMSQDNLVLEKILRAEYAFVYDEARRRHTRFSGISNAITQ